MTNATDNRTTELLDGLRNVGNLHEFAELFGFNWYDESYWTWHDVAVKMADNFEQAIAATLGSEREKALEELVRDMWFWGYEGHMDSESQDWQMKHIDGVLDRMKELGIGVDDVRD